MGLCFTVRDYKKSTLSKLQGVTFEISQNLQEPKSIWVLFSLLNTVLKCTEFLSLIISLKKGALLMKTGDTKSKRKMMYGAKIFVCVGWLVGFFFCPWEWQVPSPVKDHVFYFLCAGQAFLHCVDTAAAWSLCFSSPTAPAWCV